MEQEQITNKQEVMGQWGDRIKQQYYRDNTAPEIHYIKEEIWGNANT